MLILALFNLISNKNDYFIYGIIGILIIDAYFALKFEKDSDKIEYSALENFGMESWSQSLCFQENKDIKI